MKKFYNLLISISTIFVIFTSILLIGCNYGDKGFYMRAVTSNDVIIEENETELFSLSFTIRPQIDITDLLIRFSFYDADNKAIIMKSHELGNVAMGNEYKINFSFLNELTLSEISRIKKYTPGFLHGKIKVMQNIKGICFQHNFNEGYISKQPTCSVMGERIISCKNCNYTETHIIACTDHNMVFNKTIKEPQCIYIGENEYICTTCAIREMRYVDPTLNCKDNNKDGKCDTCNRKM